jgi:hypothetical protein
MEDLDHFHHLSMLLYLEKCYFEKILFQLGMSINRLETENIYKQDMKRSGSSLTF